MSPPQYYAIHGFGLTPAMWSPLENQLGGEWTTPCLPGHSGLKAQTWEEALEAIANAAPKDAIWLGYSMGARVALGASTLRDDIRGVVALSGHAGIRDAERPKRAATEAAWGDELRRNPQEFWRKWSQSAVLQPYREIPPAARERWDHQRTTHDPLELSKSLTQLGQATMPNYEAQLLRSQIPRLLVVGQRDPKYVAIADGCGWAQTQTIPEAGHSLVLECPRETAGVLSAWLGTVHARPYSEI